MGCLFACFGASKHRKRRPVVNPTTHLAFYRHEAREENARVTEFIKTKEDFENPYSFSREKQSLSESNAVNEASEVSNFAKTEEETQQSSALLRVKLDEKADSDTLKKVTFDLEIKTNEETVVETLVKDNEKEETLKETKLVSYIPNNRYENCADSEDESEDLGLGDADLDDHIDGGDGDDLHRNENILFQEESSESLFSLSIDSRKYVVGELDPGEKEVSSPMPSCVTPIKEDKELGLSVKGRDRSEYVCSVLNPIENMGEWKVFKGRGIPSSSKYKDDKENLKIEVDGVVSPTKSLKLSTYKSEMKSSTNKDMEQDIAVDTSLSSWLVEAETTPMSNISPGSVGNSPAQPAANMPRINEDESSLAALADKELKKVLPSLISHTRSRSQGTDEPEVGTVGSYWSCTGQIMVSDSISSSQELPLDRSITKVGDRMKWGSVSSEIGLEKRFFEPWHLLKSVTQCSLR